MSRQRRRSAHGGQNRLRIIGGQWRGRRLEFPDIPGLRPTPDRVRETLFNWLQTVIVGTRCLDLFAGSGALGLEALSRGATHCVFVDENRRAAAQIEAHLHTLHCNDGLTLQMPVHTFLERGPGDARYDIVFLDPPFAQGLIQTSIKLLEEKDWLNPGAHIYLETENQLRELPLPANWRLLKEKTSGQVTYRLVAINTP
ncbi:MAG: 16S rRNA (guanine(966)-N(2))-methyltransferase RsmD [Gammaproteobacteria bacterium]|nr:16S rRNA (guanine(966)-N(2))-methyltransferase RsmD [Gammaproteobacteria bacterium]MCF6362473.1 16S rRNA (guanine(966)-N(2))-methyltransferase RsmD [Gammaproteobacteria bacterium]